MTRRAEDPGVALGGRIVRLSPDRLPEAWLCIRYLAGDDRRPRSWTRDAAWCERMLHALQSRGHRARLPAQDAKQITRALQSTFRLVEALSSRLARDEGRLVQLTEQRAEALEGLYCNRRVLVEGVAGSGKTILGMRRALAFAGEGGKTLFLCFNRRLAEHLGQVAPHQNLAIRHFQALSRDVCVAGPGGFQVPEERDAQARYWREEAPERMFLALDDLPEHRFDAIVVDEAQDFQASWWDPVEALLREPDGPLYIFFDRLQNLYGSALQLPRTQAVFQLHVNCRDTRRLAEACGSVLRQEMKVSPFSPEGASPPQVHRAGSPAAARQTCTTLLSHLLGEERFPPSRVAILSSYTRQKSPSLSRGNSGTSSPRSTTSGRPTRACSTPPAGPSRTWRPTW